MFVHLRGVKPPQQWVLLTCTVGTAVSAWTYPASCQSWIKASTSQLVMLCMHHFTMSDRAFTIAMPCACNSMPDSLHKLSSLSNFFTLSLSAYFSLFNLNICDHTLLKISRADSTTMLSLTITVLYTELTDVCPSGSKAAVVCVVLCKSSVCQVATWHEETWPRDWRLSSSMSGVAIQSPPWSLELSGFVHFPALLPFTAVSYF